MNSLSKSVKYSPVWLISFFISVIAIFFIYLPFQIDMFSNNGVKQVYYVDNISEAHQEIIKRFNERYKGEIEVIPVNLPFHSFTTNDRKAILTRSLRSKSDGIDIFAVDLIWIPRFAKWGYSLDRRFSQKQINSITENVLSACYIDNKLVAFPTYIDLGVLHYRKDQIMSLPDGEKINAKIQNSITWKEFIDLGKRFGKRKNPFYIFQGSDYEGLICSFDEMLTEDQTLNLFNDKPVNLNTEYCSRALTNLSDLIQKYKFSPERVTEFDEFNSYIYAINNEATFLRGWVGFHRQYKKFLSDTSVINQMDIAPLPHFEGQNKTSVFGGWCLMISKYSERKEEAVKFIEFMFEEESQKLLYESGGVLPVNDKVYEDEKYISQNKQLGKFHKFLKWGKHRPALQNYTRISEIMSKSFHQAIKNEQSVEEALQEASRNINNEKFIK